MLLDHELMEAHLQVLFTYTQDGRLHTTNEPNGRSAPRFILGRTHQSTLYRFRHDLPQPLIEQLTTLAQNEPLGQPLTEGPKYTEEYKTLLQSHAPIEGVWAGPAYWVRVVGVVDSAVVALTRENVGLLPEGFGWLRESIYQEQPCLGVARDGQVVSICRSVRIGTQAHEAGVETLAAYRGIGLAPQVVAAWAAAVHQLGRIPLYSTSWQNKASQAVARKLAMQMYGATFHIT